MKNVRPAIVRFKLIATAAAAAAAAAAANVIQYNVILKPSSYATLTSAIGQGYASLCKRLQYRKVQNLSIVVHY